MLSSGMLKASHVLMNLADLSDAFISRHPASTFGWLAMIPTVLPFILAKHVIIFCAKYC